MAFLFLDTETTGLIPGKDFVLEVAWVLTNENFDTITEPQSFLVNHQERWTDMYVRLSGAHQIVHEMHANSGLKTALINDETTTWGMIHSHLSSDLLSMPEREPIYLAGLSPQFDRQMLVANDFADIFGPAQDADVLVHHRQLDLTSVKLMLSTLGIPYAEPEVMGKHRALADVYETIEQARIFRNLLSGMHDDAMMVASHVWEA